MFGFFKVLSRLSVAERTLLELSKRMEESQTDWTDMHSRCRKLMLRAERRADEKEGVESLVSSVPNGEGAIHKGRALTTSQMAVQQTILRRRAGLI